MKIDNVSYSPNWFAQAMIDFFSQQGEMVERDVSGVVEIQRGDSYMRFLPDFEAVGETTIYTTTTPMYGNVGAAGALAIA